DDSRRADADPPHRCGLEPRRGGRLAQRSGDRLRDVLGPTRRRCRVARGAEYLAALLDDDSLDLGAAEVDAAVANHVAMIAAAPDAARRGYFCFGSAIAEELGLCTIFGAGIAPMRVTSWDHCSALSTLVVTTGAAAALPFPAECATEPGDGAVSSCAAGLSKISSTRFQCED